MKSRAIRECATSIWGVGTMLDPGTPNEPLLVCHRLSAGWGPTQVLDEVSLSIGAGETLIVLGRNGVGKSTLLSTIIGRSDYKSGSITMEGRRIEAQPSHIRSDAGIGFVPQEREIFPSLSVEENLLIASRRGRWGLESIYNLFPRLKERRTNGGNQLSGGEQQMLSIGRALIGNPQLLLLDEPLEGLAPIIIDYIVDVINKIQSEDDLSIMIVEQHVDIALQFSDRVIVMDRGKIVYETLAKNSKPDRSVIEGFIEVRA
jgi:branched-chain amino acid transport system ATP-binding protein